MLRFSLGDGELDIKRCYFNGTLKSPCPKCGKECAFDGRSNYVSYPKDGDGVDFYCDDCDHNWEPYKVAGCTITFAENKEEEDMAEQTYIVNFPIHINATSYKEAAKKVLNSMNDGKIEDGWEIQADHVTVHNVKTDESMEVEVSNLSS